jgi:hypothetical protein
MTTSFVYIWHDTKRNKFYIGSHRGTLVDGYVGSNKRLISKYKSRPFTFKRRILEIHENITQKELLEREQSWLNLIKDSELHGEKYYNEKKVAAGGDIISTLPEERRLLHKQKSLVARRKGYDSWIANLSKEEKSNRGKYARSCVKNPWKNVGYSGEENVFYGKKHSEYSKKLMSEKAKNRKPNNILKYEVNFPDGRKEIFEGQSSISKKFNTQYSIKFGRFIDTGKPIKSNRFPIGANQLIGCKINKVLNND